MLKRNNFLVLVVSFLFGGLSFVSFVTSVNASSSTQDFLVSLNDKNDTVIGSVMTFDEILQDIAKTNKISIKQAEHELIGDDINIRREARSKQYRTLSQQFSVNNKYKPTMRFYCETTESGLFRGIKKILRVDMIRGYKGVSKQFNGSVYVNLEDANRIFYIVNGDFYNNGTTSYESGVNIGVGKFATIGFKVSSSSNHYQYKYIESRLNF